MDRRILCLLLGALAGCATPSPVPAPSTAVGVHRSPPRTFDTNLYWIEGPDGVVLVDTGFLPTDALALKARAEARTKKPVVLAVVLHANPDKFNGAAALSEAGVRVVTSAQVAALVPDVHTKRHRAFASRYPGEYPAEAPDLETFGDTTTTLEAAGLQLTLHVLGAGCSGAHVVLEWRRHLFVGDLVAHRTHAWLELGLTHEWKARLHELLELNPEHVHPGRGESGGPELLEAQLDYLSAVEHEVRAAAPSGPGDEAALRRARAAIEARYPGYDYPVFLRVGLPGIVARMAQQGNAKTLDRTER